MTCAPVRGGAPMCAYADVRAPPCTRWFGGRVGFRTPSRCQNWLVPRGVCNRYPTRFSDMELLFRRAKTTLHGAYRILLKHVYYSCRDRIQRLSRDFLCDAQLQRYSAAIEAAGCPVPYCWGFIDGEIVGSPPPWFAVAK
jgi:hypothetical protein